MNRSQSIAKLAILTLAAVALGACTSTRTQRSAGEHIDDSVLTGKVKTALIADPNTKARQIDVETFRGTVQLNGFVDSADEKAAATRVAQSVEGVQKVDNNLSIQGTATRSVGTTVDDGLITAKVKSSLIADSTTKAHEINVETRNGVVQLSGFVDNRAAKDRAVQIAQETNGVAHVQDDLQIKTK